jgi:hypothetical protein
MARGGGRKFRRGDVGDRGFRILQAKSASTFVDTPRHAAATGGAIPDELLRAIHDVRTRGALRVIGATSAAV